MVAGVMSRLSSVLCACLLAFATPAAAVPVFAPAVSASEDLLALRTLDRRMETVGYRLAARAARLCPDKAPLPGFLLHDISQYGGSDRAEVRTTFGIGNAPSVLALAPDSPAARAGLREDDGIVAIDGRPVPHLPSGTSGTFTRLLAVTDQLEKALAGGEVTLTVERNGARQEIRFSPEQGCPSRFQTRPSETLDARANGDYVEATTAMVAYAGDDAELAAVLGHEMAHNILKHRARLNAAGIQRGLLQQFGRNARLTRNTEVEADRFGVYLMAHAGFDPQAAVRFWERYGREHGAGIFRAATHPSERRRIEIIKAEIARMQRLEQAGQEPLPDLGSQPN